MQWRRLYYLSLTSNKLYSNYKFTSKQREADNDSFSLFPCSMFLCIYVLFKTLIERKIESVSRLHCIVK